MFVLLWILLLRSFQSHYSNVAVKGFWISGFCCWCWCYWECNGIINRNKKEWRCWQCKKSVCDLCIRCSTPFYVTNNWKNINVFCCYIDSIFTIAMASPEKTVFPSNKEKRNVIFFNGYKYSFDKETHSTAYYACAW